MRNTFILFGKQPIQTPKTDVISNPHRIVFYLVLFSPCRRTIYTTGTRAIPYYISHKSNIQGNQWYFSFVHHEIDPRIISQIPLNTGKTDAPNTLERTLAQILAHNIDLSSTNTNTRRKQLQKALDLESPPNLIPELLQMDIKPEQYHAPFPIPQTPTPTNTKAFFQISIKLRNQIEKDLRSTIQNLVAHTSIRAVYI